MDCFRIKIPSYHVDLCKSLHQLQQSQYLCDTILQCGDGVLYVHKLILLSCGSQHFSTYFSEKESSSSSDEMVCSLENYSCQVVNILIQGVYTGEMYIIQNLTNEIISLCKFLGLNSFVSAIQKTGNFEKNRNNDEEKIIAHSNSEFRIRGDSVGITVVNEHRDSGADDPICIIITKDSEKQNKEIKISEDKSFYRSGDPCCKRTSLNKRSLKDKMIAGTSNTMLGKKYRKSSKRHSTFEEEAIKGDNSELNTLTENEPFNYSSQFGGENHDRMIKIMKHETDTDYTNLNNDVKKKIMKHTSDRDNTDHENNGKQLKEVKHKRNTKRTDLVKKCKDYTLPNNGSAENGSNSGSATIRNIDQNMTNNKDEGSASTASIQDHTANDIEAFSCNLCQYVTIVEEEMNEHLLEIHEEKRENTQKCKRKGILSQNTTEVFACEICPYRTVRKYNFIRHERSHAKMACFKSGQDMSEFEQTYLCHTCGKKLKSKYALTLHTRTHTGLQKYICSQCGSRFNYLRLLNNHMKTHDTTPQQQCPVCKRLFKEVEIPEHACSPAMFEKHGAFTCVKCGHVSKTKQCLLEHQQGKHQEKRYSCPNCGKLFAWRSSKIAHMKRCVSTTSVLKNEPLEEDQ